ncbi:unnamed protein product [Prorocentrum cordatum]|uniref:Uncharacterized protein n=1 Tax=Prorocentrum cordatum TaxID=2364126 RepID=A0ABN9UIA8_9DINO|nr:unnamed protein product [Polarella glacialis]
MSVTCSSPRAAPPPGATLRRGRAAARGTGRRKKVRALLLRVWARSIPSEGQASKEPGALTAHRQQRVHASQTSVTFVRADVRRNWVSSGGGRSASLEVTTSLAEAIP